MRNILLGPLYLLALAAAFTAAPSQAQDDGIYWVGDYREALRQAKQTQKPIFLEFRCEA
jgi:hypothetical protein